MICKRLFMCYSTGMTNSKYMWQFDNLLHKLRKGSLKNKETMHPNVNTEYLPSFSIFLYCCIILNWNNESTLILLFIYRLSVLLGSLFNPWSVKDNVHCLCCGRFTYAFRTCMWDLYQPDIVGYGVREALEDVFLFFICFVCVCFFPLLPHDRPTPPRSTRWCWELTLTS